MRFTSPSNDFSRRHLIKLCGLAALAGSCYGQSPNQTVRIAMIGCGRRARDLATQFLKIKDVAVVALCDPDPAQMDSLAAELEKLKGGARTRAKFQDYRKLLESPDIDAVVVSSPNHWHALHAIHAMQAGKDVYLEKPVTHELWEGRQLVAAEEKYGRIIAAGFQSRSDPGTRDGIQFVREGNLGKIQSVHVCCFKERDSIGIRKTPLTPPPGADYHLWLGPAVDVPMFREKFHYDWHWAWNTGNGDIGNQTPHEIDIANRILGDGPLPKRIRSFGGRFGWNDAGVTPNLQVATYELAGVPVVIEVNNLKLSPTRNTAGARDGIRVGVVVRCEGGQLRGGTGGMYAVGEDGKQPIKKFPGDGGAGHQENFIHAVRSRRQGDIASRIRTAERAAAIAHLANISYRSGIQTGDRAEISVGNPMLETILTDQSQQLAAWSIATPEYTFGQVIDVDPATDKIVTPGIDSELVHSKGRPEFQVPDFG
ncbi:MAG: Gfo/Idh/MocA family protein [Luteolibacter sp.]